MGLTSWAGLPRFPLATVPTPLVRAHRLEAHVGGRTILIKRDDLAGFAVAGHKARQLEFLIGAALDGGCDVIVTGGGPSSNFCPAAATAAAVAGLACEVVYYGDAPERAHPNLAATVAAGAKVRFTGDADRSAVDGTITAVARELARLGRNAYPIPRGGATPTGAAGLVLATEELAGQLDGLGVEPEAVVVATGSGGACAGLAVGTAACDRTWTVVGPSVSRPLDEAERQVAELAEGCALMLGIARPPVTPLLVDARGPGFGRPSPEGEAAAGVALRTEGMVLDPVYTAKAFSVLLGMAGAEADGGAIVFWHTGGLLAAAAHLVASTERTVHA